MSPWTPEHWVMIGAFFGLLAFCVLLLLRHPNVQLQGVPSHDLANRLQDYISDMDQRMRDMPRPREVRELADRIGALERVTTGIQSDMRAQRDSNVRIESQLNLLIQAGLDRDERGAAI